MGNYRPRVFAMAVARCKGAALRQRTKEAQRGKLKTPEFPTITPHDLQHTAASLSIGAGANVKAVQTMLGHKPAAMTLDTYADLFPDDLEAVSAALDRAARASVGKSGQRASRAYALTKTPPDLFPGRAVFSQLWS
ncbi:tyrosine-type recombinase/integrase [Nocardia pseudobrasiliensis]|uniref:tyrosine-type recombinase/integrase n=1 Tax=Nocardia pseudobrasiliensis TaxID=45979 RepID=UPI0027D7B7EA|nr:tyrosine-type recombinase/integrase [Nocardia pseudobrasiliensis]